MLKRISQVIVRAPITYIPKIYLVNTNVGLITHTHNTLIQSTKRSHIVLRYPKPHGVTRLALIPFVII